jgi:hypothetical protein
MNFEGHFLELAETYPKYRPNYPSEPLEYISGISILELEKLLIKTPTKFIPQIISLLPDYLMYNKFFMVTN